MNKVRTDGVIFKIQNFGGISVYASEILPDTRKYGRSSRNNNRLTKYFGYIKLFIPAFYFEHSKHIFHSSYYRYSVNKNAFNVVTVHDFSHYTYGKGFKAYCFRWIQTRAILKADALICISIATENDILEKFPGIKREKIHVIHNGISKNYLKQQLIVDLAVKEKVLLYVGDRKATYKNFHVAVELAKRVSFKLLIVGGGELTNVELNSLLEVSYEHKLFLTETELIEAYSKAYALIYPSEREGFGIPIIEAQICSCPVLVMDTSCIPEISGRKALLCDGSLSEYVRNFNKLKDKNFYRQLLRDGYDNAQKYDWTTSKNKTRRIYQTLLKV